MQSGDFQTVTRVLPTRELVSPSTARRYDLRILDRHVGTYDRDGHHHRIAGPETESSQPLTRLRGAGVEVDGRLAGKVAIGACTVALTVMAVVLFVAGVHKNDQITSLQEHGVPVRVTVSACQGLLGGSGSNAAGYSCTGTFAFDGRRFSEAIPGNDLRAPGSEVEAIAVAGSPPLLDTASAVKEEHASWNVFVVPGAILVALFVLAATLVLRRRRSAYSPLSDGLRVSQPLRP